MSLRLRAVLIAGISLAVLWAAAAAWMMRDVHDNLDRTLDGRLAMSARMVAELLQSATLSPSSNGSAWTEAIRVNGDDGIACEIRSLRGEVLARTDSEPHSAFESLTPGYSTREMEGTAWRVYILRAGEYQITTADRIAQRDILIQKLLRVAGVPFLIALFGGLAALWIGIGRGLSPLHALRKELRNKATEDTTPIHIQNAPSELRPVLTAMNGLLGRLTRALSNQRAFTDAAAHELRTPLTVIDTHLQVVRLTQGKEAEASLSSAEEGVQRLRRTLDQMMTLARAEAPIDSADACDSVLTAVNNLLDGMGDGERGRIQLIATDADAGTTIPKSMLETALRNLVDNALRHAPNGSPVVVQVCFDPSAGQHRIDVIDCGPGLSAEQSVQIGRRFWRGDQGRQRGDGAGLGISIVRAIVERFGGALELRPRDTGGLIATLRLPLQ